MLRLIVTIAVGFALLVGVGAWFDPEGAREALRRDLEDLADHREALRRDLVELADQAVGKAGEVAKDAVGKTAEAAKEAVHAAAAKAPAPPPMAREEAPAAGPRTEKKRPPVLASAVQEVERAAAGPAIEEVELVARGEFAEAPLPQPGSPAMQAGDEPEAAALVRAPVDAGEQGVLIRRMLALYQRVGERR